MANVRTKAMQLTTKHLEAVSTSLEQVTEQAMSHLDHLPKLGGGLGAPWRRGRLQEVDEAALCEDLQVSRGSHRVCATERQVAGSAPRSEYNRYRNKRDPSVDDHE